MTAGRWDAAARRYDQAYSDPASRAENKVIQRWLRPLTCQGGRLLDLGCGTGLVLDLVPELAPRYVGVDISPAMLEVARGKHPEATLVQGDLADPDAWPAGPFNGVAALFSLSEVADTYQALFERMLARLGAHGHALVITYGPGVPTPQQVALTGNTPSWVTPQELLQAAERAGFAIGMARYWRTSRTSWPRARVALETKRVCSPNQRRYVVAVLHA